MEAKPTTTVLGDGTRVRYRLDGPADAPVLVLSNSIATPLEMWDRNISDLAPHFRVVRYDMRGHGLSDAPAGAYSVERLGRDVIELLDFLEVDVAHFCGLSLGGFVGQWLGIHAPERIGRLVLANTAAYLGPSSRWDEQIAGVLEADSLADTADRFLRNWFPDRLVSDGEIVDPLRASIVEMRPGGLAGCLAAVRDVDLRRTLALVLAPTLVIIGEHDTVCRPEHGALIANAVPAAQSLTLPVTHLTNIEDPERFTGAVCGFLLAG